MVALFEYKNFIGTLRSNSLVWRRLSILDRLFFSCSIGIHAFKLLEKPLSCKVLKHLRTKTKTIFLQQPCATLFKLLL